MCSGQNFLIDYGLMWVGDGEESDETLLLEKEEAEQEQSQSAERTLWHPGGSTSLMQSYVGALNVLDVRFKSWKESNIYIYI